ncbi:MAG: YkvA family protein [Pseudonocardia sp.]|nr:YkvA family protein [Pseudonocardia sp.]
MATTKYGPQKLAAFRMLWRALSEGRRPGAPGLADRLRALPRMAGAALSGKYPGLSRGRLTILILAVAYLVSPVDLVPEVLFSVFGLVDDGVVALWLGGAVLVETQRYLDWENRPPAVVEGEFLPGSAAAR